MKPIHLLLIALLTFSSISAQAQFSFGIKAGYSQAWLSSSVDNFEIAKLNGLSNTVVVYRRINKILELGVEPGLVKRGQANGWFPSYCCLEFCDCFFPFTSSDHAISMNYIQLPLLVKAGLPLAKKKFSIAAKIGGGPSWMTSGTYQTEEFNENTFEFRPVTRRISFDGFEGMNRWDWGFYTGAGIGYPVPWGSINVEIEKYYGMSAINKYHEGRNRNMNYSIVLLLDIKSRLFFDQP